jgi:hypothetical protein
MSAVFELAVEDEFDKDCAARRGEFGDDALSHPLPRTARQRKFDALHQPDVALKAMIEGRIRRVVVDADSVVVDMGRTSRLFTGNSRSAARMLVTTCTHRGCDIPARFCDVDHRKEWTGDNGPTDQANAMPLCGPHDRWKHANQIRSRRAKNGRTYLIRPDGSTVKPAAERNSEWVEPPPFEASPADPLAALTRLAIAPLMFKISAAAAD